MIERLADIDEEIAELFLNEQEPSVEVRLAGWLAGVLRCAGFCCGGAS